MQTQDGEGLEPDHGRSKQDVSPGVAWALPVRRMVTEKTATQVEVRERRELLLPILIEGPNLRMSLGWLDGTKVSSPTGHTQAVHSGQESPDRYSSCTTMRGLPKPGVTSLTIPSLRSRG